MNNWGANHGSISYGHIGVGAVGLAAVVLFVLTRPRNHRILEAAAHVDAHGFLPGHAHDQGGPRGQFLGEPPQHQHLGALG